MGDALAHKRLTGVRELIDRWGDLYDQRWGKHQPYQEHPELDSQVKQLIDEVRTRTRFAHHLIIAMGEKQLATKVVEHEEGHLGRVFKGGWLGVVTGHGLVAAACCSMRIREVSGS